MYKISFWTQNLVMPHKIHLGTYTIFVRQTLELFLFQM